MTDNNNTPNTPQTIVTKKRGLGRGLDALFEDTELRVSAPNADAGRVNVSAVAADDGLGEGVSVPLGNSPANISAPARGPVGRTTMNVASLVPGKFQPRHNFNDDTIHQLAQSIAQHGIIQPLLVRPLEGSPGKYEIIAGERRWRAAQKAQLHDVPVIINDVMTDREALQLGLIENLQREDLNAVDEALGYQRLMDDFHFTPERLGEMIGKSRSHIVNTTRLLQLPGDVRDLVVAGKLSAGHARTLIGLPTATAVAEYVIEKGLSVRATEKLVASEHAAFGTDRKAGRGGAAKKAAKAKAAPEKDMHLAAFEKDLTDALGLKATVEMTSAVAGTLSIEFKDLDQLDGVVKRLMAGGR